jgi:polyhydroxyalkanoate synthase
MMQGEKRFVLGGSGHIAGMIIPPGSEKYGYYVNRRNPEQADSWLAGARYHTGSWWPEWLSWLNKHSGRLVKAPVMTDLVFKPLVDAPGSYVFQCNQRN